MAEPIQRDDRILLQSRPKVNNKRTRRTKLATEDIGTKRGEPKLHDDALKRVTTQRATIIETKMVKGFHPEP